MKAFCPRSSIRSGQISVGVGSAGDLVHSCVENGRGHRRPDRHKSRVLANGISTLAQLRQLCRGEGYVYMIILLTFAALIGSAITFVLLWPYGLVVAVVGLPFGGSLFALLVVVGCALRKRWSARHQQPANKAPAENCSGP